MPNEETTTKFKVDISELKKSMQEAKRSAQLAHSEFKVAASECDNWQQSSTALSAKIKALNSTLNEQKSKLALLEAEYDGLTDAQKQGSAEATRLLTSINKQKAAINATQREIDGYEASLKDVSKAEKMAEKTGKSVADCLDELADSAEDAGDSAEKASDGFTVFKGALATVAGNAITGVANAIGGLISNFANLANETREYRTEMGKLNTAFTTNGHSAETATKTYNDLYAVLGDEGQAVEASNHLAKLAKTEEDLANWTNIATGVYGTFGASLPIEGLTEAANETAKVGQVTGPLADALNWAGVSEDKFNESLAACSSEQERQELIMTTLNGLYGEAANKYKEVNGAIMDANRAQAEFTNAQAGLGAAMEPVTTGVKLMGAEFINTLLPSVTDLGQGFADLINGVDGAGARIGTALSSMLTTALTQLTNALPQLAETGASLIVGLVQGISSTLPQLLTTLESTASTIVTSLASALPMVAQSIASALPQLVTTLSSTASTIVTSLASALPMVAQSIASAIPEISTAITSALPDILQAAISLVESLVSSIDQILPPLISAIPVLIEGICSALTGENLQRLIQGICDLCIQLVGYVPTILEAVLPMIPVLFDAVCQALSTNLPIIIETCIQLIIMIATQILPAVLIEIGKMIPQILSSLISGLINIFASLLAKLGEWIVKLVNKGKEGASQFVTKAIDFIKELPSKIWTWLTNAISKVKDWVTDMVDKAKQAGSDFVNKVIEFVTDLPSKIGETLSNVINKIVEWASNLASEGAKAATDLFTSVTDGIKELPEKLKSIGKDVVEGFKNGIKNAWDNLTEWFKGLFGDLKDIAKKILGIKSPSREFKKIGKFVVAGLIEGVNSMEGKAEKTIEELSQMYVDAATEKVEALKEANELAELSEYYFWEEVKSYCAEGSEAYATATEKAAEARNAFIEATTSRKSELLSSMGVFDAFTYESAIAPHQLIYNMKSQADAMRQYNEVLTALSKREGVAESGLLEELQALGLDSLSNLQSLNFMNDLQLAQFIKYFLERNAHAEARVKEEFGSLESAVSDEFDDIGATLGTEAINLGGAIVGGVAEGIRSMKNTLITELQGLSGIISSYIGTDGIAGISGSLGGATAALVGAGAGVSGGNSIVNNYTQVINSPKQLNRLEIYRNTNNLLNYKGGK